MLQRIPCVKAPPVVVPMHDADLPPRGGENHTTLLKIIAPGCLGAAAGLAP